MSSKRANDAGKLLSAQEWILMELRALRPGARLSTSDIAKRISRASRKTFHKNSVYNALRLLVRRGIIAMVQKGRQKMYHVTDTPRSAVPNAPAPNARRSARSNAGVDDSDAALPHKLALGEILVVRIRDGHLVTATNLHGRLTVERHPLPG